jgi:hypothetical protein
MQHERHSTSLRIPKLCATLKKRANSLARGNTELESISEYSASDCGYRKRWFSRTLIGSTGDPVVSRSSSEPQLRLQSGSGRQANKQI